MSKGYTKEEKEALKPNFTCPVCGKYHQELHDKICNDPQMSFVTTRDYGQYYCCSAHYAQHTGHQLSILTTGDPIFKWELRR